jgi:hypothetical protein
MGSAEERSLLRCALTADPSSSPALLTLSVRTLERHAAGALHWCELPGTSLTRASAAVSQVSTRLITFALNLATARLLSVASYGVRCGSARPCCSVVEQADRPGQATCLSWLACGTQRAL